MPLPPSLRDKLNTAAFKGKPQNLKDVILSESYTDVIKAFPDKKLLCSALEELAFQEGADTFARLLKKFSKDNDCLSAIVDGYNKDYEYHYNHGPYSEGIGEPTFNYKDMERKTWHLQRFAREMNRTKTPHISGDER